MPDVCTSCGAQLAGAFCMKCGQRAQAPAAPAQGQPAPIQTQPAAQTQPAPVQAQPAQTPPAAAQTAKPAAPARKRSGWGKALVITGCILLLLFGMAIAGTLYGVHWIKSKVSSYTGGLVGGSSGQVKVEQGNSCALLSREELQQVLGVAVEKNAEIMEQAEPGCAYYTNSEAFAQLQKMAMEQARRDSEQAAKQPAPKTDNPLALLKDANQMEGIVKGLTMTQPDKEGRVFSFTVQRDFGSGNWPAFRTTMSAIPGFEDVPGVGDHAMMGSFGHAFYVLKGDEMVHLELTYVPEAKTRGAQIGSKIAAHL